MDVIMQKKWQQIIYTSLWKNTMRYKASKAKGSLIQLYPAANLQEILIRTEEHVERHQVCAAWEVQSMGDSVALIAWDFFQHINYREKKWLKIAYGLGENILIHESDK